MADLKSFSNTELNDVGKVKEFSKCETLYDKATEEDKTGKKTLPKYICNGSGDGSCLLNKQLPNINVCNVGVLSLCGLGLKQLELDFTKLVHIFDLDLSCNELSSLPSEISALKQLLKLNLSHNKFESPPMSIVTSFYHISHLDLSSNILKHFNSPPLCLPFLTYLNLRDNCLSALPLWLNEEIPSRIEYLDLSLNPCFNSRLSEEFSRWSSSKVVSNVRTLKVANTCLSSSALSILKNFTCLSCLDIGSIPYNIEKNRNVLSDINTIVLSALPLEELEAANCGLSEIPADINQLIHLRVLNISGNKELLWLPESVCQLLSLVVLDVSNCSLILLPQEMGLLSSLQQLWLSQNQLSSLPSSIYRLTSLEILDLFDNHFEETPNIEDFHSLKGFDIGANFCDPPQLRDEFGYICLRDNLRCSLKSLRKRYDLKKIPVTYESEDDDDDCSRYSSRSWEEVSEARCEESKDCLPEDLIEENWEDNDIDDNFDPNNCLPRWERSDSLELLHKSYELQRSYYKINYEVRHFHGTAVLNSCSDVEGQYDDA